jgi:tRNA(Ile)-lysidine synthase
VQAFCKKLSIPCREIAVDVPVYAKEHHLGEEEAARLLRYRAFAEAAGGHPGTRIALAHHMEDNAETVLLQMIRGSGLDGLCGMRPVRTDREGVVYIRPLLTQSRASIEDFLRERGQEYCVDSTNADLEYSRNRMRHQVMPVLSQINTQAVLHIHQAAGRLSDLRDYIEEQLEDCDRRLMQRQEGRRALSVEALSKLPQVLRIRLIQRAISEIAGGAKDLSAAHFAAVEQLMERQTGRSVNLPGGLVVTRGYTELIFSRANEGTPEKFIPLSARITKMQLREKKSFSITLGEWKFTVQIVPFDGNMAKIPRKICTKWFDYDKIKEGFTIRTRQPGDFFLLDAAGHRKKLENYFVDEKIPADARDRRLLVSMDSEVLWIVGGRMGYAAGISERTHTVLEMTCKHLEGGITNGLQ